MQLIASSLALGLMASLSGCMTTEPEAEIPGCRTMECVAIGQSQDVGLNKGDLVVTPLEVIEDSRCPIEAECVWEGQVVLRAQLTLGHEVITVDLNTQEPLRINAGMLSIGEVAPEGSVEWMPIAAEAYRFGFTFAPDIMDTPTPAM